MTYLANIVAFFQLKLMLFCCLFGLLHTVVSYFFFLLSNENNTNKKNKKEYKWHRHTHGIDDMPESKYITMEHSYKKTRYLHLNSKIKVKMSRIFFIFICTRKRRTKHGNKHKHGAMHFLLFMVNGRTKCICTKKKNNKQHDVC